MIDTNTIKSKILDLALCGKLSNQKKTDHSVEDLYSMIQSEKQELITAKKIKKEKTFSSIETSELLFEIPATWKWVRIGQIFTLQAGKNKTASDIEEEPKEEKIYPCYGGNGLRGYVDESNVEGRHVLIGRQGALCGNINFAEDKFWATEHAVVVYQYANTSVAWAGYFLRALNLNQYATSVAQPGLAVGTVENVLIPLPPLEEQYRIAEMIEKVFSILDTIHDLQNLYESDVEVLRSKLIDAGIQGKLTEQLPEDGTAEELFAEIQAEKQQLIKEKRIKKEKALADISEEEIPFEIPNNWKWVRWGELSQSIQYGYNAPAKQEGRIKMVRISDIQDGKVLWDTVPYCDIDETEIESYLLHENDILFARTGGTVGKSYIVADVPEEAVFAGYLIRTSYSSKLCARYMKYFMESKLYWRQLQNGTIATAQPNCNGQTLSKMVLPLPPYVEQVRIVQKLDALLGLI